MNLENLLRLGFTVSPRVGPRKGRALVGKWGSWKAAEAAAIAGEPMGRFEKGALASARSRGERTLEDCARHGVEILFRGAPGWPDSLGCLTDEPEVLFLRGRRELLGERGLAIVGTRECSPAGAEMSASIARRVSENGWAVVSGLARGIDAAAHRGALEAAGDTVAVVGCGPDVPYPEENAGLHSAVCRDGLLVSEFAPGMPPVSGNFPRRNRIIAALSEATLVVECGLRSGARITARHALEQGKDVLVVPGWPTSPHSAGPLALLREGARPVRGAEDVLEDLGGIPGGSTPRPEEVEMLEVMRNGADSPEEAGAALGLSAREARDRWARLELLGLAAAREPRG